MAATANIDFYILPALTFADSLNFCSKLIYKVFNQGFHLYIHCETPVLNQQLSDLLWQPSTHFLPQIAVDNDPTQLMIKSLNGEREIVEMNIYLPNQPLIKIDHRLLQVVPSKTAYKERARQHYRHYQSLGLKIATHSLTAT